MSADAAAPGSATDGRCGGGARPQSLRIGKTPKVARDGPCAAGSPAVDVRGLTRSYGKIRAVDGLDLEIPRGQVFGLLGPNGCGKTTAIKVLCGLLRPDAGAALVLGFPPGHPDAVRRIGYMPQETALYEDMTVRENLRMFAGVFGVAKGRFLEREAEVLRFVDLEGCRNAVLGQLSGGQRHRVSLAVSMVHDPELLFLDEPTVGVDPPLRAAFWRTFRGLRDQGKTIVMTTHYMDEARNCDAVALMRGGRLIARGAPQAVMASTGTESLEDAFLALAGDRRGGVA